jgi:hypothetical protein
VAVAPADFPLEALVDDGQAFAREPPDSAIPDSAVARAGRVTIRDQAATVETGFSSVADCAA